jgi:CRISPR-associated protein Cas2
MVVLMMERVPIGLRGELSRWMIEPRAGVFVGRMSAMVRDRLWLKACKGSKEGAAMMLFTAPTEQGFAVRSQGDANRRIVDVEGLLLVRVPKRSRTAVIAGQAPADIPIVGKEAGTEDTLSTADEMVE